jgi:colanic acid biosynthesis glycosyl transferase WcaI
MLSKKLRITLMGINYAPETTGNAPYTQSLAEGLAAEGHDVRVITGYPHYPEWRLRSGYAGWSKNEVINGVRVKRLRHYIPAQQTSFNRLHMELSFGLRLIFARWGRPDAVLVISPALFSSALALIRIRLSPRRPAAGIWVQDIYSRGIAELNGGRSRMAKYMSSVESSVLKSADGVVAIHDRFQQHFIRSLGVEESNVRVIRNWTHLPEAPTVNRDSVRTTLGWGSDEIIVLHAGNMGQKQGLENVVNAARLADASKSRVRFVLMGDGNQRRKLEKLALGLTSVQFVSALPGDEYLKALAVADALLVNELPGVKDMAVPSKLTSYFNSGVPVIAATDPGSVTATELDASDGGVRVQASDPHALLAAAEALGSDKKTSHAMGERGLKFRRETLSEAVAIRHYNDFITSLASSRGR